MKEKIKLIFKELFLTKRGWLAILFANLFWSSFWLLPLIYGFITQQNYWYGIAGAVYLFFWQPLIPMWIIVPFTAIFIKNKIFTIVK